MRALVLAALAVVASPATAQADRCARVTPLVPGYEAITVFFATNSAALDDRARAAIRRAAGEIAVGRKDHVCLIGRAAPTNSVAANERLAAARVRSVTEALVSGGVARASIGAHVQGAAWVAQSGEADNAAERSVTILYPR